MKRSVRILDIMHFMYLNKPAVYACKDYFVLSPVEEYPDFNDDVRINCLLLFFCIDGDVQIKLNNTVQNLRSGDCLIIPPNSIIGMVNVSRDCITTLMGYSMDFISTILLGGKQAWKLFSLISQKPIINNDLRYLQNRVKTFLNILRYRTGNNDHYLEQLSFHLFAAMFYDVINDVRIPAETVANSSTEKLNRNRPESLYKRFIILLSEDDGEHRNVGYFADKLFVSPKYISRIVKTYSKQPAQALIIQRAVERIKVELKYTDKPLKLISENFHFENYPSFCKFVKRHLGKTPMEYRKGEM